MEQARSFIRDGDKDQDDDDDDDDDDQCFQNKNRECKYFLNAFLESLICIYVHCQQYWCHKVVKFWLRRTKMVVKLKQRK
jgi:hypothetical protein